MNLGSALGVLAITPFLALIGAAIYATILFWPGMLLIGALHSFVPMIPALGWQATWLVIAVLYIFIPTGSSSSS